MIEKNSAFTESNAADAMLWHQLVEVVRKVDAVNFGYDRKFTRDTRIVEDLDLLGDPAGDLLDAIVEKFDVDFSDFPFKRYFVEESFSFLPLFLFWRKSQREHFNKELRVITLRMLEHAIKLGRWDTQIIDPD